MKCLLAYYALLAAVQSETNNSNNKVGLMTWLIQILRAPYLGNYNIKIQAHASYSTLALNIEKKICCLLQGTK